MLRYISLMSVFSIGLVSGCGALSGEKSQSSVDVDKPAATVKKDVESDKTKGSLNLSKIQLKSASLLATHTENVFGPGISLSTVTGDGNDQTPKSIFVVYQNNFGSDAGLSIGDKFGDAPTESYFMGLAIAGETIARNCQKDVLTKKLTSKCKCDDEESAKALLGRAFSQWDFETPQRKAFVSKVAKGCQSNYTSTINGIVMSLAFALRG